MRHKLSHNSVLEFDKDKIVFTQGLSAGYYAGVMMLGLPILGFFIYSIVTQQLNLFVTSLGMISIATTIGGLYKEVNIDRVSGLITIKWLLYKRYPLFSQYRKTPLGILSFEIRGSQSMESGWVPEEQLEAKYYFMNNDEVLTKLNSSDTFVDLKKHIVINGEYLEVRRKLTW